MGDEMLRWNDTEIDPKTYQVQDPAEFALGRGNRVSGAQESISSEPAGCSARFNTVLRPNVADTMQFHGS